MKLNPLSPDEERVIVRKGTERPFTGAYDDLFQEGQCRRPRTPAQAVGLTDHRWTLVELLSYPLPMTIG